MKKLTNKGIEDTEDADGVIDITLPNEIPKEETPKIEEQRPQNLQRESNYEPQKTKNQRIKEWNHKPETRRQGILAVKKTTYIALWTFAVIVLLVFVINMIWGNIIFQDKEFAPVITNDHTINVESPNVSIPVENNHEIKNAMNVTIVMGDEIAQQLADKVIDIINNETNSS